ncbi:MAG: pyridoxine 5'-phosphate synthase [Planctomycetia bacterium]|nr:pyridoxine 5'-phosphate synthase [Planctomycetia bacterium]
MLELGVNIDHVATVRQARKTVEPDPVWAAAQAELGGADGITVHLREDRRHIQDRDLFILKETVRAKLNMEMACSEEVIGIACRTKPDQTTLVPEKREEVTTEGGLDIASNPDRYREVVRRLQDQGIAVSMFLDPELRQIETASQIGANAVELHTGAYSLAISPRDREKELNALIEAGKIITEFGMRLHAGHGLTYHNVQPVAAIANMQELNIGHSIIARALMVGLKDAVAEMKMILKDFAQ